MIGKCSSGGGMGVGDEYYSKDKKKRETILRMLIFKNAILAESSVEIEKEAMGIVNYYNENKVTTHQVKNYVLRFMLSLQDKEKLSEERWLSLVKDFGIEQGFDIDEHQYLVYLHNDTNFQHVHVMVNRVRLDSSGIIKDSNFGWKTENICKNLGIKYGLKENPTRKQTARDDVRNVGRTIANQHLRDVLTELLSQRWVLDTKEKKARYDTVNFINTLASHAIESKVQFDSSKNLVGISFNYQGENFTGQNVGFKAREIQKALNFLESQRSFTSINKELS